MARQNEAVRRRNLGRAKLNPFTYGDSLNPELHPSSSTLRHRIPQKFAKAPYEMNNQSGSDDERGTQDVHLPPPAFITSDNEEEDDDDLPLGLAIRRAQAKGNPGASIPHLESIDPPPTIRLRRGSEGYEIRPLIVPSPIDHTGEDSEEEGRFEQEEQEFERDENGDAVRRGDPGRRYRFYTRSEGSDASLSDPNSNDSMQNYLED